MMRSAQTNANVEDLPLGQWVDRARRGHTEPLAELMRAHNQRLFRIARSILRDDAEAEDIVQEAFVKAFTSARTIRQPGTISAWLYRVTANLALDRLRQKKRQPQVLQSEAGAEPSGLDRLLPDGGLDQLTPERLAAMGDIRKLLEAEIDRLPGGFREVFVLRMIEQMPVSETARTLDIAEATVKTRLHRARALLRCGLEKHITALSLNAFPFGGVRCARTTKAVIARLQRGG